MAETAKVTTSVTQKNVFHRSIRPSVFTTITINATDAVEKPPITIIASRLVNLPSLYRRFVKRIPIAKLPTNDVTAFTVASPGSFHIGRMIGLINTPMNSSNPYPVMYVFKWLWTNWA
jgi:hypothetical protein